MDAVRTISRLQALTRRISTSGIVSSTGSITSLGEVVAATTTRASTATLSLRVVRTLPNWCGAQCRFATQDSALVDRGLWAGPLNVKHLTSTGRPIAPRATADGPWPGASARNGERTFRRRQVLRFDLP